MQLDPKTDLVLTRTLPVPRSLVWECWTNPEHLAQFFVPRPHRVTACHIDLRVGGRFDTSFDVDGATMENTGVYLEIVPEERLVFTDAYSEGWKPAPEPFMTAILLLEDTPDGGTKYTAIARHRSEATRQSHEDRGFYDGWGTVVDQMVEHIQAMMQR